MDNGISSFADESSTCKENSTSPRTAESRFVARLINVELSENKKFISQLHDCYLPVWKRFHDDGIIISVSVFELNPYDSNTTNTSTQDYLVLFELGDQAKPENLVDAENTLACPDHQNTPVFSIQRSALMSCTPNSCYEMPESSYEDASSGINFLIEFIGVEETPSARKKYRELVSKYFGPANGILVDKGLLHCFVALENIDILFDTPGAVPWNQIHISDDWDIGRNINWDSVYTELFRSTFSCDLDSVWAELPPTDKKSADYHGHLMPEFCVR